MSAPDVRIGLGITQALALAAAAVCAYVLTARDFASEWLACRLKAESGRLAKARKALELGGAKGPDEFKAAAEHFSTDLVEGHLRHLEGSSSRHGRRAFVLAILGAVLAGLGAFAAAAGAVGLSWLVLVAAFVGVLSPSLIAPCGAGRNRAPTASARSSTNRPGKGST